VSPPFLNYCLFRLYIASFSRNPRRMDLSVLHKKDWIAQQKIKSIQAMCYNKNPKVVSIVAFLGASDCRQAEPFTAAISSISKHYEKQGILINYDKLTNTLVKELGWTVSETFDCLISADLHAVPTHFHQGNQTACRTSFNIFNINKNLDRLEYHPGVPCGIKTFCPVWRQDKWALYDLLMSLDLCAPTMPVDLTCDCFSDPLVVENITR
jgi:hypothetical protein